MQPARKILAIAAAALLTVGAIALPAGAQSSSDPGGTISLSDLVTAAKALSGQTQLTPQQKEQFGIAPDADITLTDLVRLAHRFAQEQPSASVNPTPVPSPVPTGSLLPDIGSEQAIRLALAEVPGATRESVTSCELDTDDGVPVYEVDIVWDGFEYSFDIARTDGSFRSWSQKKSLLVPGGSVNMTEEQARQAVLAKVPGADASSITEFSRNMEDGVPIYEGSLRYDGRKYDFEIQISTGEFVEWSWDVEGGGPIVTPVPTMLPSQDIGRDEAIRIALAEVPGATQIAITKCDQDYENGIQVYDVELTWDGFEYAFDITKAGGEILTWSQEKIQLIPGGTANVTEEQARALVLARVPQANAQAFTEFSRDTEDGVPIYEGELVFDGVQYDFEIQISTGEFVHWAWEKQIAPPQPTTAPTSEPTPFPTPAPTDPAATPSPTPAVTSPATEPIGTERAIEIALGRVPGATRSDVVSAKMDTDDGMPIYEIEIRYGGADYEIELSAIGGGLYKQSMEKPVPVGVTGTPLGQTRAIEIALGLVPGATAADVRDFDSDTDDGTLLYEIEIRFDGMEHDFEIVAVTGDIIGWDQKPYARPVPMPVVLEAEDWSMELAAAQF